MEASEAVAGVMNDGPWRAACAWEKQVAGEHGAWMNLFRGLREDVEKTP